MDKIINNKRYDTDRARLIASWQNVLDRGDPNYIAEHLYKKKSGEHFLHGEGYARYGEWHGNTGGWGEKIMPMSSGDARLWTESHLTASEYEEIFGIPEEGKGTLYINGISNTARQKLETLREETGQSIVKLLEEIIRRY